VFKLQIVIWKALIGMQQSFVLRRTNPWNIFISIVGTPAHISKLHTNNGSKETVNFYTAIGNNAIKICLFIGVLGAEAHGIIIAMFELYGHR
jgi:hypothetical protein